MLGSINHLAENRRGASYEVDLLDTEYVRELLPALDPWPVRRVLRLKPLKVSINDEPEPSNYNPSGLPECTVTECSVSEFGPVTFPAYQAATAGRRCLTDELAFTDLSDADRLEQLASYSERIQRRTKPSSPRTPTAQPAGLWGVEDSAAEAKPDWWLDSGSRPKPEA